MAKNKIVLLDGAVGTSLWAKTGDNKPVWRYNIERPDAVSELCREYMDAGAQILLCNTFSANAGMVKHSPYSVKDVVSAGVRIVKEAVKGTDVQVALSAGPLSMLLEPYGDLTEEEAAAMYREQLGAGMAEGPDLIMLQTFMDVEMMRVAATEAKRFGVPVFCTMTFEKVGKTIMGNSVEDVIRTLEPLGIDGIGMNCSLGPDLAVPVIRQFVGKTSLPLVFKPNAGKPVLSADGKTETPYDAATFVKDVLPALDFVSYIGGCCGSDPSYIRGLKKEVDRWNGQNARG